mgnify:CR=1 FL=1
MGTKIGLDRLCMMKAMLVMGALIAATFLGIVFADHKTSRHSVEVSLTEAELDFINTHPEVTLAGGISFEPFLIKNLDDNISGYDVDIAKLILKRTGLKISFKLGIWNDIQENAKNRELDGLSTAEFNEERTLYYNKSIPYANLTKYALVRHGNPKNIHSLKDFSGKKIAMQKGNTLFDDILKNPIADIEIIHYDTMHEMINSVATGSTDITILDESTPYIAHQLGLSNSIDIAFPMNESFNLFFLVRNDWPEAITVINKGLTSISKQEFDEIKARWFKPMGKQVSYSLLIKSVSILFVLLSLISAWAYAIHRAKKTVHSTLKCLKEKDKELEIKNKALEKLSVTDPLTSLYNRVKIDQVLEEELVRAERSQEPFGIIFIDIDFFKTINDTYGHQIGDDVLKSMAYIMKRYTREVDVIGRWGGEEFLIISPLTDKAGLHTLAEKLRKNIEQYDFSLGETRTASFGVAIYQKGDISSSIVSRADAALYRAKETGRNKVVAL